MINLGFETGPSSLKAPAFEKTKNNPFSYKSLEITEPKGKIFLLETILSL